jgi:hypothetical protein
MRFELELGVAGLFRPKCFLAPSLLFSFTMDILRQTTANGSVMNGVVVDEHGRFSSSRSRTAQSWGSFE